MRIKPMLMGALALGCACALSGETKEVGVKGGAPGVAVQKLQTCDFLLNKDFKKNAKYYLCLFSASWCGPCRREMPRIAKTYAESLKADPNVELIHFSCDREEDKALAWAKEHDVQFPVVKYNGGNPLDLRLSGIPHLFIVKADGTLVEEGHPMKLFTDEKLRELKDEVELPYEVVDGAVIISAMRRLLLLNRPGSQRLQRKKEVRKKGKYVAKIPSGALVIPDVIDGFPVGVIGHNAFSNCKKVTSVTIPSSVTNIVSGAFRGFNAIASFSVDAANPSYSSRNGLLCSKDVSTLIAGVNGDVTIPSSVTNIVSGAFSGCYEIMSFSVDAVNPSYSSRNGLLCSKDGSTLIAGVNGDVTIPSSVTRIGDGAFDGCSGLTSVTIPSSVTSIGDCAFYDCTGLKSIRIPSSVKIIERDAFGGCNTLASVSIPEGVTSIGCRAFACCRGLTSVTISSSVKRIEREAFLSCDNLKSISVEPDNPSYSSRNGLLCSKDGSILVAGVNGDVTIPSSVTCIGDGAFDGYGGLTSVTIPSSVTSIGGYAFNGCANLASMTIPSSVTRIGSNAFSGTPFYKNMPDGMVILGGGVLCGYKGKRPSAVEISSNVTSIADGAFSSSSGLLRIRDNVGLKTVVISSSVTNIGNRAFLYCGDLVDVTMRGERPDAPKDIFERCGKLKSIHVPANAKSWEGMKAWQGIPLVFDAK